MKKHFLNQIICVNCKGSLKLTTFAKQGDDVEEGKLSCACGSEYPIINGIPRIVSKELFKQMVLRKYPRFFERYAGKFASTHSATDTIAAEKTRTASAFGKKWQEFGEMQNYHKSQFLDWIWPITSSFFKGKTVLDAGCGQGRHAYFAAKFGAKSVIGIDLSEAVDLARQHTKQFPNVCIVQGDIFNMPVRDKEFDYAFSIGVLHHLPHPESGFDAVLQKVKPGGMFSSWVYGSQGMLIKIFNATRKHVLAKLPMNANWILSLLTTSIVYPSIKLVYEPLNAFAITQRIANHLPQNKFFIYLGKLGFRTTHEILYDQFIAPTAFYYSGSQFKRWFNKKDIKSFQISERNKNSWRGLATKK